MWSTKDIDFLSRYRAMPKRPRSRVDRLFLFFFFFHTTSVKVSEKVAGEIRSTGKYLKVPRNMLFPSLFNKLLMRKIDHCLFLLILSPFTAEGLLMRR